MFVEHDSFPRKEFILWFLYEETSSKIFLWRENPNRTDDLWGMNPSSCHCSISLLRGSQAWKESNLHYWFWKPKFYHWTTGPRTLERWKEDFVRWFIIAVKSKLWSHSSNVPGTNRSRTDGILRAKQTLYQLSYSPVWKKRDRIPFLKKKRNKIALLFETLEEFVNSRTILEYSRNRTHDSEIRSLSLWSTELYTHSL